ncbi:MAG: hypothetical protein ABI306_03345 [Caulobacteraceae bacterium]
MALLEAILVDLAAHGLYDLTKAATAKAFEAIKTSRPDLIEKAERAAAAGDDNELRNALAGALDVAAASGHVQIDNALITAARQATFDHQHGTVSIGGTTVTAPILVTGGGSSASGETKIGGGTKLKSQGTSIDIGHGASIQITGNASIKQT